MTLQDLTIVQWEKLDSFLYPKTAMFYMEAFRTLKRYYINKSEANPIPYEDRTMHLRLKKAYEEPFVNIPLLLNTKVGIFGHPFTKLILEFRLETGV